MLADSTALQPLPAGVTIPKVYQAFMTFVLGHCKAYFAANVPAGEELWTRLESTDAIRISLAHPNGWGLGAWRLLVAQLTSRGSAGRAQARGHRLGQDRQP